MICTNKGSPVVKKDQYHAILNQDVIIPIMNAMKDCHKIKTPDLNTIKDQVHILHLLKTDQKIPKTLPAISEDMEISIHLAVINIKKLICLVRDKYLRNHKPRDWGCQKNALSLTVRSWFFKSIERFYWRCSPVFLVGYYRIVFPQKMAVYIRADHPWRIKILQPCWRISATWNLFCASAVHLKIGTA